MRVIDIFVCLSPSFMGIAVGTVYNDFSGLVVMFGFAFAAMAYLYLAAGEDEWDE